MKRCFIAMRARKDARALALLVALVVARLGFAAPVYARPGLALANDTDRYRPLADLIVSGNAYGWNTLHSGELANTVGYPLFLAGIYKALGHAPWQTALLQLLLSGTLALVVYLQLAHTIGTRPAFAAALLLAVDPLTILWSLTILTETLFAFLVGIAALLVTRWAGTQRSLTVASAGLVLGLACLVKPYAQLVVVVWAAGLLFFPAGPGVSGSSTRRRRLEPVLLFTLPALLLVAPWIARNAILWNCPTLSSVDRITMRDYMAAKVVAEYEHAPLADVQGRFQAVDGGVCPSRTSEYLRTVLAHPMIYARLQVAGTIPVLLATSFDRWLQFAGVNFTLPDLWRPYMDGGVGGLLDALRDSFAAFPGGLVFMGLLTVFQLVVYVLVVLGLLAYRGFPSGVVKWNILMLCGALLILLLTPGQGGNERFRVPAQPLFAILAAYGIAWRLRRRPADSGAAHARASQIP